MKKVYDWSDISVGQYQEMMLVETDNELTTFIERIAIALDIDPQEIREMPYADYQQLQKDMHFILEEPIADISHIIEVEGKKYGLEPDMKLISTGVFIDGEQFKREPFENLHRTLALIYRPLISDDGDNYEIEPHKAKGFEARANLFKEKISIEKVLGASLFFSLNAMESSIHILDYLKPEMEMKTQAMMKKTQAPTKKRKQKRSGGASASMI